MDKFDQAQEIELMVYKKTQLAAMMAPPARPSAKSCANAVCGEEIPEARRVAVPGVQLCKACQERYEFKRRMRGG